MSNFSSSKYWETRYVAGGNSGAGSFGRLAKFKASFLNAFVELNKVGSVIDFGCGDGNMLEHLNLPNYIGVDTSPTALVKCRNKFSQRGYEFIAYEDLVNVRMADLALSIDVIYHLIEDDVFEKYLRHIFTFAANYVIFYSSDYDARWPTEHVRHRSVSNHVHRMFPEWSLRARVPNLYPHDFKFPDTTSFADFLVYARNWRGCQILVPDAERATDKPTTLSSELGDGTGVLATNSGESIPTKESSANTGQDKLADG